MTAKAKAAAGKSPTFEDEARYRIEVGRAAAWRDIRFLPQNRYVVKGKVASAIADAITSYEPA